jgi:N-acetylglucosamine-6-phosphate deacetylase
MSTNPLPVSWTGPGLVDLQVNGYAGFDFNSPAETWRVEDMRHMAGLMALRGVAAALPTFITDDAEAMLARARRYAEILDDVPSRADFLPLLHIEGPFISRDDGPRGAHPLAHCRTPRDLPDLFARLREASGDRIGILTLAPELPGAMDLIAEAAAAGVCVGIGHTNASPDELRRAVEAGARLSTHLGNGSHQVLPRLDNYVQSQLADDRLVASFIADGHHMPFPTLQNMLRAKTLERSILVTDAMAAADEGPGRYTLGGEEVAVSEDLRVAKPGEPNLAGSALTLDRAVVNVALHCGVAFEEAWRMASELPAKLVGLPTPEKVRVKVTATGFLVD